MKLIIAYLPPECVEAVIRALGKAHVHGLSVSHARGFGQEFNKETDFFDFSGSGMTKKVRLESACHDDEADRILDAIYKAAHTGLRGNGKIFVLPLADALRLKTGERGPAAIGPET